MVGGNVGGQKQHKNGGSKTKLMSEKFGLKNSMPEQEFDRTSKLSKQTTPSYQECNFNISPDVDELVRVQTVLCASAFKSGFALSMKLSIFFRERIFLTTMTSNYCHYHL